MSNQDFPAQKFSFFFFILLFLEDNICCIYSLEEPQWGTSNEYYNISRVERKTGVSQMVVFPQT